eukprot:7677490-Heterocapsa_arctica.AAC.1
MALLDTRKRGQCFPRMTWPAGTRQSFGSQLTPLGRYPCKDLIQGDYPVQGGKYAECGARTRIDD